MNGFRQKGDKSSGKNGWDVGGSSAEPSCGIALWLVHVRVITLLLPLLFFFFSPFDKWSEELAGGSTEGWGAEFQQVPPFAYMTLAEARCLFWNMPQTLQAQCPLSLFSTRQSDKTLSMRCICTDFCCLLNLRRSTNLDTLLLFSTHKPHSNVFLTNFLADL